MPVTLHGEAWSSITIQATCLDEIQTCRSAGVG